MREIVAALDETLQRDEPVALATVVEVKGASPAQVGFKLLVRPAGQRRGGLYADHPLLPGVRGGGYG